MNIKKLSPVAEFLRANQAKAKNIQKYTDYPSGIKIKTCEFYSPDGSYLGRMSRTLPTYSRTSGPYFANLKSYIETMESKYKAGYRQVKENTVNFAKILGVKGDKETYLPEKIVKKQTIISNQSIKTEDVFERTISSELELIKKANSKAYGEASRNVYIAKEPIQFTEVQTSHNVTKSDKF